MKAVACSDKRIQMYSVAIVVAIQWQKVWMMTLK